MPTIGFLEGARPWPPANGPSAFVKRLRELDWVEGKNLSIEYRWAEGRTERYPEIVGDFVRLQVAVIVTAGTESVIAAKQLTSTIPIVFATAGDPVGSGLVASLARPGGNVTGLSNQQTDLAGKRLGILLETMPISADWRSWQISATLLRCQKCGMSRLWLARWGLQVITSEIQRSEDIEPAFDALKGGAGALYVVIDPLVSGHRIVSIPWRWVRDCQPCMDFVKSPKLAVSCLMAQTSRPVPAHRRTRSTRSSGEKSQPTSRLSSRPNSNLSST